MFFIIKYLCIVSLPELSNVFFFFLIFICIIIRCIIFSKKRAWRLIYRLKSGYLSRKYINLCHLKSIFWYINNVESSLFFINVNIYRSFFSINMIPGYISVELSASLIVVYLKIGEILVMIISSWRIILKKKWILKVLSLLQFDILF